MVAKILGAVIRVAFASYTPGLGFYSGVQSKVAENMSKLRKKCAT